MTARYRLSNTLKAALGEALAAGHRHFGKVAARRPYLDDDEGGSGGLQIEPHPLLSDQPVGAPSDLTQDVALYADVLEATKERANDLSPELRYQPALQQNLKAQHVARPTPYGGG